MLWPTWTQEPLLNMNVLDGAKYQGSFGIDVVIVSPSYLFFIFVLTVLCTEIDLV